MSTFGRLRDPAGFGSNRAGRDNPVEILPGVFAADSGGRTPKVSVRSTGGRNAAPTQAPAAPRTGN